MLGGLLNGMFDKEQMTYDTVQNALDNLMDELNSEGAGLTHKDMFIMIRPTDTEFNHKYFLGKFIAGNPVVVRELTLKEILTDE